MLTPIHLALAITLAGLGLVARADTSTWVPVPLPERALSPLPESEPAARALVVDCTGSSTKPAAVIPVGRTASALRFEHTFLPGPATLDWQRAHFAARWEERPGDSWRSEIRGWKKPAPEGAYATTLPPEPPVVLRYRVTYADGETQDALVRFSEGVHAYSRDDYFTPLDGFLSPLRWAELAWQSPSDAEGRRRVTYAMIWPNPRPEKPIASVQPLPAPDAGDWGVARLYALAVDSAAPAGRAFYVAPAPVGDDAAPGTFDRPFASPARGLAALSPGDTLYLRGGRYAVGQRLQVCLAARADAWTTITAYPGETPVLDYATFAGLDELPGKSWSLLDAPQFQIGGSRFLRIRGLVLENILSTGIGTSRGPRDTADVELLFNTIHRSYHSGIFVGGQRVRVVGNLLLRTCRTRMLFDFAERYPALRDDPFVAQTLKGHLSRESFRHECLDIGGTGSRDLEAAFNEVARGDKEGIDCKGAPDGVRIHHNFVHHITMPTGIYVDGWTRPLRRVEVTRNVVCHNAVTGIAVASEGGSGVDDVRVAENVVFANGYSGLLLSACNGAGRLARVTFERNVVVANGDPRRNPDGQGGIHIQNTNIADIVVRENLLAFNRDYAIATTVAPDSIRAEIRVVGNHATPPLATTESPVFPGSTLPKQTRWTHLPDSAPAATPPVPFPRFLDPATGDLPR